jgi:hypothetical protein
MHTLSLPLLPPWIRGYTVPPLFLLIASRTDVRRISMDPTLNDNDVSLVTGLNNTLAIDYRLTAPGEGQIIFTDKILDTIFTANFDGSGIMEYCGSL